MSGEVLRIAAGIRLGTALCEKHTCKCGAIVEPSGHHGLSCTKGAGRQQRHGMLNDVIWRAFTRAKIPAIKEPNGLSRSDGKRPDGVTIIPWSRGRCLAWDVTVPDTFAASYQHLTSENAGAAAERAARNKESKYAAISQTHHFVPVAVETAGSWHTESLEFVNELGGKLSAATGDQRETSHLFQRLSVAIQIGNSMSVLGTSDWNKQKSDVPESKSAFVHAENSTHELMPKIGRRMSEAGVRRTDSQHQETSEKLDKSQSAETSEKPDSAHSLKKAEKMGKLDKQQKLLEAEKALEILITPSTPEKDVSTQRLRAETAPVRSNKDTDHLSPSPIASMDRMEGGSEMALKSVGSNLSLRGDANDEDKALKVIDLPMSPIAVKRQRQISFYEHVDKLRHSRSIEAEDRDKPSTIQVRPAISGASMAIKTIRRILPGDDDDEKTSKTDDKKRKDTKGDYHNV